MTRLAKFVSILVAALAISALTVTLLRPMKASAPAASATSMQIDQLTRSAGPLHDLKIENYY